MTRGQPAPQVPADVVGLAVTLVVSLGLVVLLVVRDEFPIPPAAPLPAASVVVETGTSGPRTDGADVVWPIVDPNATLRVVNNTPSPTAVTVTADVRSGCDAGASTVEVDAVSHDLGPDQRVTVRVAVPLDGYDRVVVPVVVRGSACTDGAGAAPVLAEISRLTVETSA